MFVDYDNVAIAIENRAKLAGIPVAVADAVVKILSNVKENLETPVKSAAWGGPMRFLLGRAYGTWTTVTDAPSALALMSIQPAYVLTKPGKSSADLELSLEALETLLLRDDVDHFVIIGGDRDYIPVVRRIRERGKGVTVAALESAMSGDLRAIVGKGGFVPLDVYVAGFFETLKPAAQVGEHEKTVKRSKPVPAIPVASDVATKQENLDKTLDLVLEATVGKGRNDVALVSFYISYMNEAFVTLNNQQRKELVETLRQKGIIDLEMRADQVGFESVVLILKEDHPAVKERIKARENQ